VKKYDPDGNALWTRQLGTFTYDNVSDVAVDGDGSVYVVGHTGGAFPGGSSAGNYDAFLVKWNALGDLLWIKQFGTSEYDEATSILISPSGEVYVLGRTTGSFPGAVNAGQSDVWLARFIPLPGDFNGDGSVDTGDYIVWRKNGGSQIEYDAWRANFGRTLAGSGSNGETSDELGRVPEPAGGLIVMTLIMNLALVWRVRRRVSS
jgi:hypothetical protein